MDSKTFLKKAKKVALTLININKYVVVLVLGVLLVGLIGKNSVRAHMQNAAYIGELQRGIAQHKATTRANVAQLSKIKNERRARERVAREHYFLKQADEDVFVLSDDDLAPQPPQAYETVE